MDLEQCLELLKSSSNEKKLVGLLFVSKFISSPEPDVLRSICDAISFDFLNRMLFTPVVIAEGVSVRGLALSIYSTFSMDTQLAGKEGYIKAIPAFLSALHSGESSERLDALRCLVGGAENVITLQALLEVKAICQITQSISAQDSTQDNQLALKFHLFDKLCGPSLAGNSLSRSEKEQIFTHLVHLFRENQTLFKFQLLERLIAFLSAEEQSLRATGESMAEQHSNAAQWQDDLRVGIFHILASKLGGQQKDMALALTSLALRHFGQEWAVGTARSEGEDQSTGNPPLPLDLPHPHPTVLNLAVVGGRLVELLVSLAGVEISIALEPDAQLVDEGAKRRAETILAVAYSIIESTITFLSSEDAEIVMATAEGEQKHALGGADERRWLYLPQDSLHRIQKTLREVFGCVVEYLKDAAAAGEADANYNTVLFATVRILGVWISQETLDLRSEIIGLLPFLLRIAKRGLDSAETAALFSFLLPGLLHITSEEEGRRPFLLGDGVSQLLRFMQQTFGSQQTFDLALLETCLGVLINVVCLDSDLVARDATPFLSFLPIVQHCLQFVQLQEANTAQAAPVLSNLLVLSTFILRHSCQAAAEEYLKERHTDFSFEQYFHHLTGAFTQLLICTGKQDLIAEPEEGGLSELVQMALHGTLPTLRSAQLRDAYSITQALGDSWARYPALSAVTQHSNWVVKALSAEGLSVPVRHSLGQLLQKEEQH